MFWQAHIFAEVQSLDQWQVQTCMQVITSAEVRAFLCALLLERVNKRRSTDACWGEMVHLLGSSAKVWPMRRMTLAMTEDAGSAGMSGKWPAACSQAECQSTTFVDYRRYLLVSSEHAVCLRCTDLACHGALRIAAMYKPCCYCKISLSGTMCTPHEHQ